MWEPRSSSQLSRRGREENSPGGGRRNHLGAGENPNNLTYLSSFLPIPTSEPPILDDLFIQNYNLNLYLNFHFALPSSVEIV